MKPFLLAVALAAIASCTSPHAKQSALAPVLQNVWPRVELDISRGILDAQEDGEAVSGAHGARESLSRAVGRGVISQVDVSAWIVLEPFGYRGVQDRVDDGEMAEAVAESLRERIRQFGRGLQAMTLQWYSAQ